MICDKVHKSELPVHVTYVYIAYLMCPKIHPSISMELLFLLVNRRTVVAKLCAQRNTCRLKREKSMCVEIHYLKIKQRKKHQNIL